MRTMIKHFSLCAFFAIFSMFFSGCLCLHSRGSSPEKDHTKTSVDDGINSRQISILLGSAPKELVSRYVASFAYQGPNSVEIWGRTEVGPDGGLLTGTLLPIGNIYPDHIKVNVITDYTPESSISFH